MMADEVYKKAKGRKITLEIEADITAASVRQIKYEKADGTIGCWDAEEESPTSISYTTKTKKDIDVVGTWKLQSYIVTPTWEDHGDPVQLIVKDILF